MKTIKIPEDYISEKYGITIKPFIPTESIADIAETAMKMPNKIEEEICIAVNVIRECTDANVDEALDNLDVDLIIFSGLWDEVQEHVEGVDLIRKYIAYKEDAGIALANFLNKTLPKFLERLDKDMDKYIKRLPKGVEWRDLVEQLPKSMSEIIDIVKEDGNAEIIQGALKMGEK